MSGEKKRSTKKVAAKRKVHLKIVSKSKATKKVTAKKTVSSSIKTVWKNHEKPAAKNNVIAFPAGKTKVSRKRIRNFVSEEERNKIIVQYYPMIQIIAKKIAYRLPSNIEAGDLISNGTIGLIDAIEKYDPTRDSKFKTYAEFRVRGAILDSLRSQDWVPRSIRDKAKKIQKAKVELELSLGREPHDYEIAKSLNVKMEEFYELQKNTGPMNLLPIDEIVNFGRVDKRAILLLLEDNESVSGHMADVANRQIMVKYLNELPERQGIILSLYYYEGFNLKKIGNILNLTESRVSQLHSLALEKLKAKLKGAAEEDAQFKKAS